MREGHTDRIKSPMELPVAADDDRDLVNWLVMLAQTDRETFRKVREIGWRLVVESHDDSSVLPNKLS
jgi:hypothetical protein